MVLDEVNSRRLQRMAGHPGMRRALNDPRFGAVACAPLQAGVSDYFIAIIDTAVWGAELATALAGTGERGRVYVVEPSGPFEDDPNVTNKKFPGNPTQSYRSRHPLRVVGEVVSWQGSRSRRPEQDVGLSGAAARAGARPHRGLERAGAP